MLKGISSVLVVLFHCPIKGVIGDGIIYALRFPIPIFLMSTGYFMYGNTNYLDKVKVFFKYLIFGEIVACFSLILKSLIDSSVDNIFTVLISNINLKTLFFGSLFNGTLWYLYAMVWTYIFMYILSRYKYGFKIGYCLIIILLFAHIVGRVYVTKYYDINDLVYIFRSAILYAVPFVLIGRFIAEKQEKLTQYLNFRNIGGLFCLGIAMMLFEYFRWHQFMDLQVRTVFISLSLFLFTLYKPNFELFGIFKYIGKNLLLYIYIFHIPVYSVVQSIIKNAKIENSNFVPLIVIALTISISYIFVNFSHGIATLRDNLEK